MTCVESGEDFKFCSVLAILGNDAHVPRLYDIGALVATRMSVHPSVCHTRGTHLNGSKYRNMLCIIPQNDVSSFLRPNELSGSPERMR